MLSVYNNNIKNRKGIIIMSDNEAILLKEQEDEEIKPILGDIKKQNIAYKFIKRFVDIIAGIVGVILLIPITIIVGIIRFIKKENDGPLFYEQLRIGKNGKQFRMYKFRSMCVNADEKLKEYLEQNDEAKKEYQKYKKLKCDPRITRVGKILRATSLDEFPQLINVLKGDMSLVGPRPYLPREQKEMGEFYIGITRVKPGITGPWQIMGRSNIEFEDRLKMDWEYAKKGSIVQDFKILLKTFTKVINKDGAV